MNVGEANAVNVVLQHVTGMTGALGQLPSHDQVADSCELLAAKADKTLSAGITAAHVRDWRHARVERNVVVASCRVCGCTDADCSQCIERTGQPCSWVEPDLCSACAAIGGPLS